jgi:hypothetical protein
VNLGKPPALLWLFVVGLFGLALGCAGPAAQISSSDSDGNSVKIGSKVGERIPDISITLIDGSTVKSSELIASGKPTFLFFFATW